MISLSKRAAPRGTGGAALAVWFSRAVTLASPPGKDGGDDRAPGHGERYAVDGCRRALEVRGRPSAPREPEHRGEVRRHGGHVARRADAPEEGQARARGQRGMGRGRPRGRPPGARGSSAAPSGGPATGWSPSAATPGTPPRGGSSAGPGSPGRRRAGRGAPSSSGRPAPARSTSGTSAPRPAGGPSTPGCRSRRSRTRTTGSASPSYRRGREVVLAHHRRPGGAAGARRPEAGEVSGGLPQGGEARPQGLEARGAAQALRAAGAQDLRRPRHGRPVVGRCGLLVGPIRSTYLSALPHRKSHRYGRHLRFNDHLLSSLWRYKVLCHHILTKTVGYLERPYYHRSRHRRRHDI